MSRLPVINNSNNNIGNSNANIIASSDIERAVERGQSNVTSKTVQASKPSWGEIVASTPTVQSNRFSALASTTDDDDQQPFMEVHSRRSNRRRKRLRDSPLESYGRPMWTSNVWSQRVAIVQRVVAFLQRVVNKLQRVVEKSQWGIGFYNAL